MVIYGAPGTGKTYRTRQLAEQIIRRAALQAWRAKKFFTAQDALDEYVAANIHWLQLHPRAHRHGCGEGEIRQRRGDLHRR
jgi:5-methylcytosine-specific restriction protein B